MELPSVSFNPWLSCSLWLIAYIYLPGMTWSWLVRKPERNQPAWTLWLFASARSIVLSLIATLLPSLLLAGAGWFTPNIQRWTATGIIATGLGMGWMADRNRLLPALREALPGLPIVLAGLIGIMLIPQRGEWIVGGWDPGIYVNQGVAVSRTGSFDLGPDPVFSKLSADERPYFTRPAFNFTEAFPVVPLDPARRSLQHFFFRLFPTWVAVADRCGGLRAATRANDFAGWLGLFVFMAAALRMTGRPLMAATGTLALLSQSIWVYHLRIPTSEMLQFILLNGLAFFLPDRTRHFSGSLIWALLLMMGVLNRFAFILFGGLLVLLVAWLDTGRADRRSVWRERLMQFGALGIGALYDFLSTPIALGRLGGVVLTLSLLFGCASIAAWIIDHLALYDRWPKALSTRAIRPVFISAAILFLLITGVAFFAGIGPLRQFQFNLVTLQPFLNPLLLLAALGGGAVAVGLRNDQADTLRIWLLFLLAATFATLARSEIAALMPWASRRYVAYTVPMFALLGGVGLGWLGTGGLFRKGLALFALAVILAMPARQIAAAWKTTEYDGLSNQLKEIAEQIGPRDVVVADHFLWATPLRLIYNKPMINGELYLDPLAAPRLRKALSILADRRTKGVTIRFLTSTDKGLEIFPVAIEGAAPDWASPPIVMKEIRHNKTADGFMLREKPRQFQLYTWPATPAPCPDPLPAAQDEGSPSPSFFEGRGSR